MPDRLILLSFADVREALRLHGRLAVHHRAPQHRAHVARVASIKIGRAAGRHALAVGVARARRRRGFLVGGEDGRRRRRVELAEVDGVAGGAVRRVLDVLARLEERALEVVLLEEVQKLVDEIVKFLNGNAPIVGGPGPEIEVGPAATLPAPAPTTPEIEVGNATTLPAPVPEPEETTPLQDYAVYEATKDISDPNTAAVAGAAAAQVAGALQ